MFSQNRRFAYADGFEIYFCGSGVLFEGLRKVFSVELFLFNFHLHILFSYCYFGLNNPENVSCLFIHENYLNRSYLTDEFIYLLFCFDL